MNPKIKNGIIITLLLILPLIICGRVIWAKMRRSAAEKELAHRRSNIWPAERKLTAEKVKARQTVDETHGAVMIDLKPYINAKLTEATVCWKGNNANNFVELPAGTNIYGGVPFDVEGIIQLMGGWLQRYGKNYPFKVESIAIHRQCKKIHLLHSSAKIAPPDFGKTVSKLVIHYEDNSSKEIDMVAGQQVFDMWWPTYITGWPEAWRTPAKDTELAWVGSNAYIRRWAPDWTVCVFRTSFENPQSGVAISSLDYVSSKTIACPFMFALTVE
jgi:hypothetical protein